MEAPAALRKRQGAAEALRRIEEPALALGRVSRRLDELWPDRAPSVRVEELRDVLLDGSVLPDASAALRLPRRDPPRGLIAREPARRDPARSAPDPNAGRWMRVDPSGVPALRDVDGRLNDRVLRDVDGRVNVRVLRDVDGRLNDRVLRDVDGRLKDLEELDRKDLDEPELEDLEPPRARI